MGVCTLDFAAPSPGKAGQALNLVPMRKLYSTHAPRLDFVSTAYASHELRLDTGIHWICTRLHSRLWEGIEEMGTMPDTAKLQRAAVLLTKNVSSLALQRPRPTI